MNKIMPCLLATIILVFIISVILEYAYSPKQVTVHLVDGRTATYDLQTHHFSKPQ